MYECWQERDQKVDLLPTRFNLMKWNTPNVASTTRPRDLQRPQPANPRNNCRRRARKPAQNGWLCGGLLPSSSSNAPPLVLAPTHCPAQKGTRKVKLQHADDREESEITRHAATPARHLPWTDGLGARGISSSLRGTPASQGGRRRDSGWKCPNRGLEACHFEETHWGTLGRHLVQMARGGPRRQPLMLRGVCTATPLPTGRRDCWYYGSQAPKRCFRASRTTTVTRARTRSATDGRLRPLRRPTPATTAPPEARSPKTHRTAVKKCATTAAASHDRCSEALPEPEPKGSKRERPRA